MIEDIDQSWQRISLRHLVALHAVATAGSFRGGAERLGYSLSTVSEQIASLERLVAQPLVIRPGGRRAISITPAGQRLLDHADEIAARFAAARADLEGIRLQRPVLRLGIYQSVAARLLPGVLGRLSTRRPDVAIEVVERADDGLCSNWLRGERSTPRSLRFRSAQVRLRPLTCWMIRWFCWSHPTDRWARWRRSTSPGSPVTS